jgi:threonine/homoserine/homoserine lactone efflux protein
MPTWLHTYALLSEIGFILALPGPTNLVVSIQALNSERYRLWIALLAVLGGYAIAICAYLVMLWEARAEISQSTAILRPLFALLIVWIAASVWRQSHNDRRKAIGSASLFFATLFNPKAAVIAYLIALGTSSLFGTLANVAATLILAVVAALAWAWIGMRASGWRSDVVRHLAAVLLVFMGLLAVANPLVPAVH